MIDATLLAALFGFAAAISWGVGDFLGAKAAKDIGPTTTALCVNIIAFVLFGVLYFAVLTPPALPFSWEGIGYGVAGGIVLSLALAIFYKALAKGPVCLVSPISGIYPLVTTLLALVVFQAYISAQQLFGIVMVVVGVVVAAGLLSIGRAQQKAGVGPVFALVTALLWGIGYPLMDQAISRLGWETATLLQLAVVLSVFCLLMLFQKRRKSAFREARRAMQNKFILAAGGMQLLGVLSINLGLHHEMLAGAIVTAVSACYPTLTILLAIRHFHEKIKPIPLAGAFVSIAGVVMLSLG